MNKMEEYIIHNNGGRPYKVQYVSKIIGSDIVYAYMLTEPGGLFVFDTHKIVNIKNPPFGVTDIFTWYYANFNVNTSTTLIDRFY
jgi:hypothetical protein